MNKLRNNTRLICIMQMQIIWKLTAFEVWQQRKKLTKERNKTKKKENEKPKSETFLH